MSSLSSPIVLVTVSTSKDEREILESVLSQLCRVRYLEDLGTEDRTAMLAEAEVLLTWHPGRELPENAWSGMKNLRLVQLLSAGADHLQFTSLPARTLVTSNVGAYAEPVAEHAVAMILALAKRLVPAHQELAGGHFDQFTENLELKGRTCAVLGFGGIGKAAARRLRPFGMKIWGINRSGQSPDPADWLGTLDDLKPALQEASVVLVALALNRATRGIIGSRQLEWMREDAILVNVARGEILDEEALYQHLRAHPKFRAGIDAWWVEPLRHGGFTLNYPFFELPNFLGSPHNSAMVPGIFARGFEYAALNVRLYLEGKPPRRLVRKEDYLARDGARE